MTSLVSVVAVPAGLGLLGFVEPCSIGASQLFIKYLEGKSAARKLGETFLFAVSRAVFIGVLGIMAALVGATFLGAQRGAWMALGGLYLVLGVLYATRRAGVFMRSIGPRLPRLGGAGASVGLGLLFGLNIPACAAPLLLALLAAAAAGGATGTTLATGFVSLGVFGLALSLPLVAAVLVPPARRGLDRLAGLATRAPLWAGLALSALGLWSIGFGLLADLEGS